MSFYPKHIIHRATVCKGMDVEVVRGRKVPLGTKGVVFWIGDVIFQGRSRFAVCVHPIGIRDAAGQVHWTYDKNVTEVVPKISVTVLPQADTNYGEIKVEIIK